MVASAGFEPVECQIQSLFTKALNKKNKYFVSFV